VFIQGGRRRGPVEGTALVVLLVLAGCGGGGSATGSGAGPTSAGGSASAGGGGAAGPGGIGGLGSVVAGVTGSADAGASPDIGSTSGSAAPSSPAPTGPTRTVADGDLLMFVTPSKNISCAVSSSGVRCDIAQHDWTIPARPATCEYDYGQGVHLETGPADYVCAGDTVMGSPDAVTLAYGGTVVAGDLTCTSTKAGVTCRNTATGRGFALSRQAFAPF
jgi:hypothetical protein